MKLHKALKSFGIALLSFTAATLAAKGLTDDDIQTVMYIREEWTVRPKRRPRQVKEWRDAIDWADLQLEVREVMVLILLDHEDNVINTYRVAEGSRDNVAVCKQLILEHIIANRACKAILVHNHPRGGSVSDKDVSFTKTMIDAISHHNCRLLEHYVDTHDRVYGIINKESYNKEDKA